MAEKPRGHGAPPPKGPSANDVAELAGVSRTQVSFVLNGRGGSHVSKEKRERILEAVRTLNYRPYSSAQSLRRGYSSEFCIFFPFPYPSGINSLLSSIHEIGLEGGCVVAQYSWNGYSATDRMKESFEAMLARKPMGIFCSLLDLSREDLAYARSRGVSRILVLDVEDHRDLDTFYLPKVEIGRLAASFLVERGHRRIAVVSPSDPVQHRPFRLNMKGMREAVEERDDVEFLVKDWPAMGLRPGVEAARRFVDDLLEDGARITAIYAHSDDYAVPLLRALHERGIAVPQDISVLGTDDIPIAECSTPSLSSIKFDGAELGQRAVAMINSLITGEALDAQFSRPPVPVVVERESTRALQVPAPEDREREGL